MNVAEEALLKELFFPGLQKRELIFEHTTQLSWHLPTVQLLNIWKSQAAKVTVLMRWQTREVMEICICLEDIFDAMPSTSQTRLVLVGAKASSKSVGAEGNSDTQKASKADLTNDKQSLIALECFRGEVNRHDVKKLKVSIRDNPDIQIEDRPMATLEISLQVLQQKPVTVSSVSHHWQVNETVKETKGTTSLHATGDAQSPIPPAIDLCCL
ncbi:hypothetical protein O6H91_09G051000 [Diphasiastrum complanatum]|uniref:Uncharacterized protein n=1 Tax=Diphasiastrum complanatum TaxID=34168 RepID=A0ACC2CP02_DIPCM|nr:hypothetical protein O6H91_09G051000 [Diphasiastrum complanatum]